MNTCKFYVYSNNSNYEFIRIHSLFLECGYVNNNENIKFYVKEITRFKDMIETLLLEIKTDVVIIKKYLKWDYTIQLLLNLTV